MWYIASEENLEYLAHHGIKGQKWGIRRYQNEDGTLTEKGRKRYAIGKPNRWAGENTLMRMDKRLNDIGKAINKEAKANKEKLTEEEFLKRVKKEYEKIYDDKKLANIVYTMDVASRRQRDRQYGGVVDLLIENAIMKKSYNKHGYESPMQTLKRADAEYRNYYDENKKVPEKLKQKYKQSF